MVARRITVVHVFQWVPRVRRNRPPLNGITRLEARLRSADRLSFRYRICRGDAATAVRRIASEIISSPTWCWTVAGKVDRSRRRLLVCELYFAKKVVYMMVHDLPFSYF